MGWFSGKKSIYVSSVVYNLAGSELDRPQYLKSLVANWALKENNGSVGEAISDGLLAGPGIRFRQFASWANSSGYNDVIGLATGGVQVQDSIDESVVEAAIPHAVGESVLLQFCEIGRAKFEFWAEQFVLTTRPELFNTNWVCEYLESSNEVLVVFEDTTSELFTPVNYDKDARYLYASYSVTASGESGVVVGDTITLTPLEEFPSLAGWTVDGDTWVRETYVGQHLTEDYTYTLREIQHRDVLARTYRIDSQELIGKSWSPLQYFIYKQFGGNSALDGLFVAGTSYGEFFPPIPVRLNNQFVSETYLPDVYAKSKKAVKKAINGNFDELVSKIADNESIGDIDYAYVTFGVSLNVLDLSCKKYIYKFFESLLDVQGTSDSLAQWVTSVNAANASMYAWQSWKDAQSNPSNFLYGSTEPDLLFPATFPEYSIRISTPTTSDIKFDMQISWSGITEETGLSLQKPDAIVGDIWFEVGTSDDYAVNVYGADSEVVSHIKTVKFIKLIWQRTSNSWASLKIYNLYHRNHVYGGKAVVISAAEALADIDESGFIIPLHRSTYNSISLVDSTQMSTACCFIVFNCYQIVKQKWYQTGIFQFIVFVVSAIYFGPVEALAQLAVTKVIELVAVPIFGEKLGRAIAIVASVLVVHSPTALSEMGSAAYFAKMATAKNLLLLTKAVGDAAAAYMQVSAQEVMLQTADLWKNYESKMGEIQALMQENFGYGHGVIDIGELITAPSVPLVETPARFLERTLMTGDDIVEISIKMLEKFPELTTSTKLPI